MADRIKNIITDKLTVKWAMLTKPDTMFDTVGNHNISVLLTPEFEAQLLSIAKENGCKKINGVYEKDGIKTIKFKSSLYTKKGETKYPCQDASAQFSDVSPWQGDVVRLKLGPAVIAKGASKTMSFYLNGVQLIEKNSPEAAQTVNGFGAVDGGYVGNSVAAPAKPDPKAVVGITDAEIPF